MSAQTISISGKKISIPTGLFINNEFVESLSKKTFGVENPATGEEVLTIQEGQPEDVDVAVKVATKAFNSPAWKDIAADERGRLLNRLADIMEQNKEELIAIEMLDTGKTYKQAAGLDFPGSVGCLRYFAGWAGKIVGQTSTNIPGTFSYTRREPIGVCGQIIPWNFPLLMFVWKIAPALVTGNTIVIKSSETTPLSALKMCEYIIEAGLPAGTVNLISGFGKTVGAAIANHMGIGKVAFTGSTATGRTIMKAAASSNLKKVTLELGGKGPNVVFPDADIKKAVEWSVFGLDMNMGQTCHAGTRIYVHEDIYDDFITAFTERFKSIRVGDNFDNTTDQGPQNSKMQYDRIMNYIQSGKEEGATLHLGGHSVGKKGYFIEPTIFTDVKPTMKIVQEEIFGPVVVIAKFKTEEDVIELANDSSYGLAAGIFTNDYERAMRVTAALQAGTLWVNFYNVLHWSLPFGGYKESGIGRECGEAALENYTEVKTVMFNMGMPLPDIV
ncbi:hypothetical protein H2200_004624 [Cladophialophora chaetospira]|uniref:aldehyde dehydrogenase (NAD(+)) n=1 Tax=Cladophialophora chaetospira TaxID=386627 RepID=A0AA38XDM6_9EURO|nr:hypothetical protein H2200_004624 [Cladophialophora chaetospira]